MEDIMKKIVHAALEGFIFCTALTSCWANLESQKSQVEFSAMNTQMTITAYGKKAEKGAEAARDKIAALEALLSVTEESSDVHRINDANGEPVKVDSETAKVISLAVKIADETGGAFNPALYPVLGAWGFTKRKFQVPPRSEIDELLKLTDYKKIKIIKDEISIPAGGMIDLGGIGKGYAGGAADKVLRSYKIKSAILNLGGNVQVIGGKPDGSYWNIGIRSPFEKDSIGALKVKNAAVITSGGYIRYFVGEDGHKYKHIFDPTTGAPVENEMLSSTVIGSDGGECDALATAFYVMGAQKSADYWRRYKNFDMILITDEDGGTIYLTKGIKKRFTLSDDYKNVKVKIIE